jgi:hypothetical protein
MTQPDDQVLELVARTATITDTELAERPLGAQRDRTFEQIVASAARQETDPHDRYMPRIPTFPRRAALAVAGTSVLIVALIAVLVGQGVVSPTKAKAAGVHFVRHGGYIDATIDDPRAPAVSMEAAFAKAGLDVTVDVIPASPSLAGTITFIDTPSSFEPIYAPEGACLLPGGGTRCVIGMRVPADFSGSASIQVNGTPPAGQLYDSVNEALAPGEVLHCSGVRGMTVADAVPILRRLGVTLIWRTYDEGDTADGVSEASIENEHIVGTLPRSLGTVYLWVQPSPPSPSAYYDALHRGC